MKGKAALSHARRALLTTRSLSSSPQAVPSSRAITSRTIGIPHPMTELPYTRIRTGRPHYTSGRYACDNHLAIAWLITLGQSEASIYGSPTI